MFVLQHARLMRNFLKLKKINLNALPFHSNSYEKENCDTMKSTAECVTSLQGEKKPSVG